MAQKITQVDAFTSKRFGGNPAGVCLLETSPDEQWMQLVAREMNLSETAFLLREGEGYRLRWFTPANEVPLCGHATLASAHVLYQDGIAKQDQILRFETLSGPLFAKWNDGWIELNFPQLVTTPAEAPKPLISGLNGASIVFCGKNKQAWLVELNSEEAVRNLKPITSEFKKLDLDVLITAKSSTADFDFVSRYFAPLHDIDEDPVTGSAHCMLAPYWSHKLGKNEFRAYQASARGGFLKVRFEEDRVVLIGQAVTVLRGELL
jgi:PhzF family phenazine biosynthesis protein